MCRVHLRVNPGKSNRNCCETMNAEKLYLIAKSGFRASVIILNHIYLLTYLTWVALLYPLKKCGFQNIFYKIEGELQYGLLQMIAMWSQWAKYEVFEAGDDITECLEERTLVLVNHQSTGDVPTLFSAFISRTQIIPNIMWIMDNFMKYSTAGIVCLIHRDFFIFQGKETRERSLEDLSKHLHEYYLPLQRKWLMLFPEGGFLYKRKETSQRYGKQNNLPHLEHVTIPRVGALQVIMKALNPKPTTLNNNCTPQTEIDENPSQHLKYILDVTIAYEKADPINLLVILFGSRPACRTTVYYRLYPINEVPSDNDELSKWLLDRWVEKEKMLDTFYKTGEFPMKTNSRPPTIVRQNLIHYLALHMAFLASLFFHYRIITLAYQYCCSYLVTFL